MGFFWLPLSAQWCWLLLLPLFVFLVLLALLLLSSRLPRRRRTRKGGTLRIAFVHPDLGIGGAERLVVDAAVALQGAGHEVVIFTARHEREHCFEETRDGTLTVEVRGGFLPRHVLGRFYAACAYLRMSWAALRIALLPASEAFDVMVVDQVSICIPIVRFARPCGIIFYCHYPDKLLAARGSIMKGLYRVPLDLCEELTTGMADVIFVNSRFTASVFSEAFPLLRMAGVVPKVLYPALNLEDQDRASTEAEKSEAEGQSLEVRLDEGDHLLLSINRFERKKNVGLAVRALAAMPEATRARVRLVLAGGYDERLPENVEHAGELETLASELGVASRVRQMHSVPAAAKAMLLRRAACLLYTPDREHLGIVPLEAMYARVPVIAVASGGPLETVVDGVTGFLRPPDDPEAWAEAIGRLLADADLRRRAGQAGRARVAEQFSLRSFGEALGGAVEALVRRDGPEKKLRVVSRATGFLAWRERR